MNSKGIQPKVGMVVMHAMPGPPRWEAAKKITEILQNGVIVFYDNNWASTSHFTEGNYEIIWSEETRDEWLKAAGVLRSNYKKLRGGKGWQWIDPGTNEYFAWMMADRNQEAWGLQEAAQICESLAYDGMAVDE